MKWAILGFVFFCWFCVPALFRAMGKHDLHEMRQTVVQGQIHR